MKNWKIFNLSDLMEIKYGKDHKHLSDGPYPLFGSGGIMRFVEKPIYEEESILIPRKGTLSNLFYVNEPFWSVDTMFWSKINPKLAFPKYLFYTLKTFDLASLNVGSAVPSLTTQVLNEISISLPDLPTQTAIAEILSSLDDKIELNNKINQELETLAQTLFKQWFIDFDFPNENGEPYKSSGGEMVESELGEIPKGWKVENLETLCLEITRGFTTKYVEKSNIINLNQKVNRGFYLDKSNYKYYNNDTIIPANKFACHRDILINSLGQGTLGRIHFYFENTNNVVVDQHITIVRANQKKIFPELAYYNLSNETNIDRLEKMVTGSTGMLMLNISKIREFKMIIPPYHLQEIFNDILVSHFERIQKCVIENEELIKLRDTLLPKLISGELEVN